MAVTAEAVLAAAVPAQRAAPPEGGGPPSLWARAGAERAARGKDGLRRPVEKLQAPVARRSAALARHATALRSLVQLGPAGGQLGGGPAQQLLRREARATRQACRALHGAACESEALVGGADAHALQSLLRQMPSTAELPNDSAPMWRALQSAHRRCRACEAAWEPAGRAVGHDHEAPTPALLAAAHFAELEQRLRAELQAKQPEHDALLHELGTPVEAGLAEAAGRAAFALSVVAGDEEEEGFSDGVRHGAVLRSPSATVELHSGGFMFAERGNASLRLVRVGGTVTTLCGRGGGRGYRDGEARHSMLHSPAGLCLCLDGSVAVADAGNHCVRMVRGRSYRPEELERDARFMPDDAAVAHWSPHCMNHDRLITIAGRPKAPGSADSHASAQSGGLDSPSSVLQLPTGELLVADTGNHTIRLLVTTAKRPWVHGWDAPAVGGWRLSTVAGRAGEAGCVDGEQQENDVTRGGAVRLREPTGLCRTADGAILFVTRSGDDDEGAVRQLIPIGEAAARKWVVRTLYGGRPLSRLTAAFRLERAARRDDADELREALQLEAAKLERIKTLEKQLTKQEMPELDERQTRRALERERRSLVAPSSVQRAEAALAELEKERRAQAAAAAALGDAVGANSNGGGGGGEIDEAAVEAEALRLDRQSQDPDVRVPAREPTAVVDLPAGALLIHDGGRLLVLSDWEATAPGEPGFPFVAATGQDVSIQEALDLHGDPIELDGDVGLSKTHGGALLLTHAAAGVIYRLLPQTIWRAAMRSFGDAALPAEKLLAQLREKCREVEAGLDLGEAQLSAAQAELHSALVLAHRLAHRAEVDCLRDELRKGAAAAPATAEAAAAAVGGGADLLVLEALIRNAPSLPDLLPLLAASSPSASPTRRVEWPAEVHREPTKRALCAYLRAYVWGGGADEARRGVEALLAIHEAQGEGVVDEEAIALVLGHQQFPLPVELLTLRLLCCARATPHARDGGEGGVDDGGVDDGGFPRSARSLLHRAAASWLAKQRPAEMADQKGAARRRASEAVRWASSLVEPAWLARPDVGAAVGWLLGLLLRHGCASDLRLALGTVGCISDIVAMPLPPGRSLDAPLLSRLLALCHVVCAKHAPKACAALLPQCLAVLRPAAAPTEASTASASAAASLPVDGARALWRLPVLAELLVTALRSMPDAGAGGDENVAMDAVLDHPVAWCGLVEWASAFAAQRATLLVSQPPGVADFGESLAALDALATRARAALSRGAVLRACPMGQLKRYSPNTPGVAVETWKHLSRAWRAMGVDVPRSAVDAALEAVAEAWAVCVQLRGVTATLLPESELLRHLLVLQATDPALTLTQLQLQP